VALSDPTILEITLPISHALKKTEKDIILNELRNHVPDLEIVGTGYREFYGQDLPLELVIQVTTAMANIIVMIDALSKMKKWLSKPEKLDDSPGIAIKVGENSYSIKGCRTAEDVTKIIREIKRR